MPHECKSRCTLDQRTRPGPLGCRNGPQGWCTRHPRAQLPFSSTNSAAHERTKSHRRAKRLEVRQAGSKKWVGDRQRCKEIGVGMKLDRESHHSAEDVEDQV